MGLQICEPILLIPQISTAAKYGLHGLTNLQTHNYMDSQTFTIVHYYGFTNLQTHNCMDSQTLQMHIIMSLQICKPIIMIPAFLQTRSHNKIV